MSGSGSEGLFGGLFARGKVDTGDTAWLQAMLDTEAALARAVERAGLVPEGSGAAVTAAAQADSLEIADLGRSAPLTGNPVPALVRRLTGLVSADQARAAGAVEAVHLGATSQDIIDTAAMLISRRAIGVILADLAAAAGGAAERAREHAGTVMAGRTLLQQAVPITFGLVAAGWMTAIDEARAGLHRVRADRLAVQFGGAAGTLASLGEAGPAVAELLAAELGLAVPVLPWHTDRLRIIELGGALAGTCAVLGKLARDVTLLAQSEVGEVWEGPGGGGGLGGGGGGRGVGGGGLGGGGRGGSSAMPHKQNTVASIVILGCAKRAPGLLATLAAVAEQEHQRAAGGWHAEWETLSDLLRLTGSAASWAADLLVGLRVDPVRMRANLEAARGLPLAENLATLLAPALGRLAAHDLVARASQRAVTEHLNMAAAVLPGAGMTGAGMTGAGLPGAALAGEDAAARLAAAGVGRAEVEAAIRPESYLGATAEFIRRALAAHGDRDAALTAPVLGDAP